MFLDLTGKRKPVLQGRVQEVDDRDADGCITPEEKVTTKAG